MFGIKWNKKPKAINNEMLNFQRAFGGGTVYRIDIQAIIQFSINLSQNPLLPETGALFIMHCGNCDLAAK